MTISEKLACLQKEIQGILWEEGYSEEMVEAALERPKCNAANQERNSARASAGLLS
jgi:hypothetical protein